jgi:hypothetical protein
MSDLLSAAGILVGVVGLLYGLWYPEIAAALAIDAKKLRPQDAKGERDTISIALRQRVRPLALASTLLSAVLAPDAVRILVGSLGSVMSLRFGSIERYDAVQACLLLVEIFAVSLAFALLRARAALRSTAKQLQV